MRQLYGRGHTQGPAVHVRRDHALNKHEKTPNNKKRTRLSINQFFSQSQTAHLLDTHNPTGYSIIIDATQYIQKYSYMKYRHIFHAQA